MKHPHNYRNPVLYVLLLVSQITGLPDSHPVRSAHWIATDLSLSLPLNILPVTFDLKITSDSAHCKNLLADTKDTNGKFCSISFYKM